MEKIAILDSGGQYCHLIARKVRELGVYAEIHPLGVAPKKLMAHRGVIISGGPSSVFDKDSPKPKPKLFELNRPILGICYGHQLMARAMDGVELARQAQTRRPGIKALYTSGYTDRAFADGRAPSEGTGLLNKPYHRAALARSIRDALNRPADM